MQMYKVKEFSEKAYLGTMGGFLAALAAGFVLSGTSMAGVASFADISLAGAVGLPASAAIFTGSLIRSIAQGTVGSGIVRISAMAIIIIIKLFADTRNSPKMCGINTAVAVFLSGAAVSVIIGELFYKLLFYIFYAIVAGFTAYSGALILEGAKHSRVIDLSSASGCAYAVVYTVLTASLCSIKLPFVNLGIICGAAITMLGAYHYRHIGGVLCGALTACGAFLASQETGMSVVLLPVAGLLCGYLHKQKINTAAICFIGINLIMMILTGAVRDGIYSMVNIIAAAVLFLVISPKFSDKWLRTGNESADALPDILSARLGFLSDSIEAVRVESGHIAKLIERKNEQQSVSDEIRGGVCENCFRKVTCWSSDSGKTEKGFGILENAPEISKENFPYELENCLHKSELMTAFEKKICERTTAKLLEMRFAESRSLLHEQIKIMSEIIESAGERLDIRYSEPISKVVRQKLEKFGFEPLDVIAYYNSSNRLLIELYFPGSDSLQSVTRICDLVSDELRLPLESSEPVNSGKELRIRLYESPAYALEVYGASICAEGCKESGDTSLVFNDGTGVSYVILSDGMGSGKKAAFESTMVVRMFRKLISCGVDYNSAIKLINSVMLTKSREESFATLDAVRVDLDECGLTIIKSGATATLVRHRGNVMKISSTTFPIGIYEQSDTFSKSYDFEDGDIVIMFSDGIDESEYRFIKELLLSGDDLKHIVSEICAKAELFRPTVRTDDVTVIGIRVKSL